MGSTPHHNPWGIHRERTEGALLEMWVTPDDGLAWTADVGDEDVREMLQKFRRTAAQALAGELRVDLEHRVAVVYITAHPEFSGVGSGNLQAPAHLLRPLRDLLNEVDALLPHS